MFIIINLSENEHRREKRTLVANIVIMSRSTYAFEESRLQDDDRKRGGLTLARYQELYAQFIGDPDEKCQAIYLFGPMS